MKDFGYNLFSPVATGSKKSSENNSNADGVNFSSMEVSVNEKSGNYPTELKVKKYQKSENIANSATQLPPLEASKIIRYIQAKVVGKYKKFKDGDIVSFTLESDLQVGNRFTGKENIIQGIGWVIDNRVVVDLGYEHSVIVCDQLDNQKGLILSSLKIKRLFY
jgi:hypothetical protein